MGDLDKTTKRIKEIEIYKCFLFIMNLYVNLKFNNE